MNCENKEAVIEMVEEAEQYERLIKIRFETERNVVDIKIIPAKVLCEDNVLVISDMDGVVNCKIDLKQSKIKRDELGYIISGNSVTIFLDQLSE